MNLTALSTKLVNDKWMISNAAFSNLSAQVSMMLANPKLEITPVKPAFTVEGDSTGNVCVIEINGILVKGATEEEEQILGLSNTDFISEAIDKAINDPAVEEICFIFNSPGGETTGIEELGRKIANCPKTTKGWTETVSASASYWLMSQCDIIGMTPSASVGSIGVYSVIEDYTEALKQAGVHKEAIYSGKYKLLGADFRKLTDEERNILQADIDAQHNKFKQAILSKRDVDAKYMEGLTYEGKEALEANLVDMVADSFDAILTTANTYTSNTTMNKFTKIVKEALAPIVALAQDNKPEPKAEAPEKDAKDVVPGVPEAKAEEPAKEAPEAKQYVECSHCKGLGKFEVKMEEPEVPKDEPEAKAEAKEEPMEAPKEEPAKPAEPEDKKAKKATLPSVDEWQAAFGYKKQGNVFLDACNDFAASLKK